MKLGFRFERFLARLRIAAKGAGFRWRHFGQATGVDLPVLQRSAGSADPRVYLSAGVHGDEPAGCWAVLALLENGGLPEDLNLILMPMINPGGLRAGTRENPEGIDLNRDYRDLRSTEVSAQHAWLRGRGGRFDAAICLHEDWEATGAYVYEMLRGEVPSRGRAILRAMEPHTGIERSAEIDGRPSDLGLIQRRNWTVRRPDLPEALWLYEDFTDSAFNLETPSCQPLAKRVAALVAGAEAVLGGFEG